jgi:hypothetical protein
MDLPNLSSIRAQTENAAFDQLVQGLMTGSISEILNSLPGILEGKGAPITLFVEPLEEGETKMSCSLKLAEVGVVSTTLTLDLDLTTREAENYSGTYSVKGVSLTQSVGNRSQTHSYRRDQI